MTEDVMSTYLSVGETASLLGKSEKWVYAHLRELPGAFKLGGSWFINKEILTSELNSLAQKPTRQSTQESVNDRHGLTV